MLLAPFDPAVPLAAAAALKSESTSSPLYKVRRAAPRLLAGKETETRS